MATNLAQTGSELQVNLAPNQNGDQFDPDIATLSDGRYFVAFTDSEGNNNIVGQFISANGILAGSNIDIDVGVTGSQVEPAVAARPSGGAIVVWHDNDPAAVTDEIHYAIVSSAGIVGSEQTLLVGGPLSDPDVATLNGGNSLVVATLDNGTDDDVLFRFVQSAGVATELPGVLDGGTGDQGHAAVAASGNTALVVYEDDSGGNTDIHGRFYDGSDFGSELNIADITGELSRPDVTVLADGRFLVVWKDEENDRVEGRFVSAAGAPIGGTFILSDGYAQAPRAAPLPDGGFIVTWEDFSGTAPEIDANDGAVHARRFDASGARIGDELLVNTPDPDSDQSLPAIATNSTGRALLVWQDEHAYTGAGEDGSPGSIRGRAVVPGLDTVTGSNGDDFITTYGLGEPINGLGGDDLIHSLAGNDIVHGGAGFDHILGGAGNDRLFGDAGEDFLNGQDGNDQLVGGKGRDVEIGGSGKDRFDFNAANESKVGTSHDVIAGFSHAEHDRIDLKTMDADTTKGGNQAFHLIGGAPFSGEAGELRFSHGLLQGDINGNGVADFEIKISGLHAPTGSDFLL